MTEQRVEEWTQRLRKIWEREGFDLTEAGVAENSRTFNFRFRGQPDASLLIIVFEGGDGEQPYVFLRTQGITLYWEDDLFVLLPEASSHIGNLHDPRAAPWMPLFRRACWLCGLPIETTAHEKTEWTQGLAREEVEAWRLRF